MARLANTMNSAKEGANMVARQRRPHTQALAYLFGGLGVLCFSLSLPATRVADAGFGGIVVGLGRALIAAALAALLLAVRRERPPARRYWLGLAIVAIGVVIGFPLCSSIALQSLPASHGAVVVGLLPSATAIFASVRGGERPSALFWVGCAGGALAVLVFAILQGAGRPQPMDALLLAAVALGGMGYAEGGRLARDLGGWRVVCWALLLAAPLLVAPVALAALFGTLTPTPAAWLGLIYVAVFSMFLGFFAWYQGLAMGGIARVSQLQLFQPLLTLGWAALLLGEALNPVTLVAAVLVVASVAFSQRAPAKKRVDESIAPQTVR
ncbi:MAG: DMT family transporter [Ktedonobacterales bacterium]